MIIYLPIIIPLYWHEPQWWPKSYYAVWREPEERIEREVWWL